jgi:HSP20 family protein
MATDRWDPFREMPSLREAMNRLLEESVLRPGSPLAPIAGGDALPVDVADEAARFLGRASLPGVRPEDVHVTVQGDTLTIRAERRADDEPQAQNWIIRERRSGVFQRRITLPARVDPAGAEARFENGELVLTLPKAEEARPRRIEVKAPGQLPGRETPGDTNRAAGTRQRPETGERAVGQHRQTAREPGSA